MPDWVIPTSAVVQAVCTIVLMVLTGCYAYWVRSQVRQDREFFDKNVAEARDLVESQAADYRQRERQQVQRAIQTILAELEINTQDEHWQFKKSPRLLDAAYATNLWAVPLVGMSPEIFRAIGEAYLSIQTYNHRYDAATDASRTEIHKKNAAQLAWQAAQAAIRTATNALKKDLSNGQ